MRHQVLNFKVAFCTIVFMCSSLSQSINVNSKHASLTNKKLQHSNGLALLPDADLTIEQEEEDDEEDDDDDVKSESDYSNEYDQGSSDLIGDLFGHPDDFDRNNALPFFHKVPENAYIMKNRQAELKCKATNALDVSLFIFQTITDFLLSCRTLMIAVTTTSKQTWNYDCYCYSFSFLPFFLRLSSCTSYDIKQKSTAGFSMPKRHQN